MVFARTAPAESRLALQFREHTTQRRYIALAHGDVKPQTIVTHLIRDRGDGRRGSTANYVDWQTLRHACQSARAARPRPDGSALYTLVDASSRQAARIRSVFTWANSAIRSAEKKSTTSRSGQPPLRIDRSGATRVMLHAFELGFIHPASGEELLFECEMPRDMAVVLQRLRGPAK